MRTFKFIAAAALIGGSTIATALQIDLLSLVFMIAFLVVCIPASFVIDTYGIRIGIGTGALLTGLFGVAKGIFATDYTLVLICQAAAGVESPIRPLDCVIEPNATIKVGSPVEGILSEIAVRRGDQVKAGELLATLDMELERLIDDLRGGTHHADRSSFSRGGPAAIYRPDHQNRRSSTHRSGG
mgnify:CR=1 FL=1